MPPVKTSDLTSAPTENMLSSLPDLPQEWDKMFADFQKTYPEEVRRISFTSKLLKLTSGLMGGEPW